MRYVPLGRLKTTELASICMDSPHHHSLYIIPSGFIASFSPSAVRTPQAHPSNTLGFPCPIAPPHPLPLPSHLLTNRQGEVTNGSASKAAKAADFLKNGVIDGKVRAPLRSLLAASLKKTRTPMLLLCYRCKDPTCTPRLLTPPLLPDKQILLSSSIVCVHEPAFKPSSITPLSHPSPRARPLTPPPLPSPPSPPYKQAVGEAIKSEVAAKVSELKAKHGRVPGLAVIIVGEKKDSQTYVRMKRKACEEAGITSFHKELPEGVSQAELIEVVRAFNRDPECHGILVQLPLPGHLDETVGNSI